MHGRHVKGVARLAGTAKFPPVSVSFACDMNAIPGEERGAHHALIRRLMTQAVEQIAELPDGLAFRFPAEEYEALTAFVRCERLCCPFRRVTLEVTPGGGPLWLRPTGAERVKEFLRAELHVPTGLAMDQLTASGLFAVTAMVVTYALEARSPWFTPRLRGGGLRISTRARASRAIGVIGQLQRRSTDQ